MFGVVWAHPKDKSTGRRVVLLENLQGGQFVMYVKRWVAAFMKSTHLSYRGKWVDNQANRKEHVEERSLIWSVEEGEEKNV